MSQVFFQFFVRKLIRVISMLVTDVGGKMWQVGDVGDGFGHFGHHRPLIHYRSVKREKSKNVNDLK